MSSLTYSPSQIQSLIQTTAARYNVDPALALAVARHESNFDPNALHSNANGTTDYGVMQLNTLTVQTLGVANPLDPQQNVDAGVRLLRQLLDKYNGDVSLTAAAYSAGTGAVGKYGGVPPYAVTQQFVAYINNALGLPSDGGGGTDTSVGAGDAAMATSPGFLDSIGLSSLSDLGPGVVAGVAAAALVFLAFASRKG